MSLRRRIERLEEQQPAPNGHDAGRLIEHWRDLFRTVARLLEEGEIAEREGSERLSYEPLHALQGSEGPAWWALEQAQRFIRHAAVRTGWRSEDAPVPDATWQLYRANSLDELRQWCREVEQWLA